MPYSTFGIPKSFKEAIPLIHCRAIFRAAVCIVAEAIHAERNIRHNTGKLSAKYTT